jgi:precorrin-6B methylase 2
MKMMDEFWKFVREHAADDLSQLAFNAARYGDIDVRRAIVQIDARRRIRDKLPAWYAFDRIFYPSSLAAEQCSSELTALYKRRFVRADDILCDLTGGLGVDAFFFSRTALGVVYVERNREYCEAASNNFRTLGADANIRIVNGDAADVISNDSGQVLEGVNVFYLDPSRRNEANKRMFDLGDCEPDITEIWELMLSKRRRIVVKLSPMLDISRTLRQLPGVREVHVVSVRNECKELLIVTDGILAESREVEVFCVNFASDGAEQCFRFDLSLESSSAADFAENVGKYLYEPNASILKAGAYKLAALRYGMKKLHPSSHLYTSDNEILSFPGRTFEVIGIEPFNNRVCKGLSTKFPRANIAVRNFPISADDLRKRTRIADGGDIYLFATTLHDNSRVIVVCKKLKVEN